MKKLGLLWFLVVYINTHVLSSVGQSAARVNTNQAQYDITVPTGMLWVNPNDAILPPVIHNLPVDSIPFTKKMSRVVSDSLNAIRLLIPTNNNQLTNGSGYLTSVPAQSFSSLTGKPTTLSGYGITDAYPLSGNPSGFLTSAPVTSVSGKTGVVTLVKGDVGLGNIDNTTDLNKPISTATQTALNTKQATITTGTTAQYFRGDLSLATFPTIPTISGATGTFGATTTSNGLVTSGKRMEIFSGVTNASGVYTVTFANTYSVAPNVQVSIANQSATNQFVRVSSITTTGCVINVFQRSSVNLLGIDVLLSAITNVTSASIDVLINEK